MVELQETAPITQPVQIKEETLQDSPPPYSPPPFVEAEERKQPVKPEPVQASFEDEEEDYPSIESHLAQLYGEVDPSKVSFNSEPEPQKQTYQEPAQQEELHIPEHNTLNSQTK